MNKKVKKDLMRKRLKVVIMAFNGKIPFGRSLKVDEINLIVDKGLLEWTIVNQDTSPMLLARIETPGLNKFKKIRRIAFSLWHSGSFFIGGVKSKKEAKESYSKVLDDLIKLTPKVFVDTK